MKRFSASPHRGLFLTIVVDVVCLLLGIVCWNTLDLHFHQRVNNRFLFVLVEFR